MDRWLLKLNEDKCKVVSYGRNILNTGNANYNLKQSILAREDSYNDLGVKFHQTEVWLSYKWKGQ